MLASLSLEALIGVIGIPISILSCLLTYLAIKSDIKSRFEKSRLNLSGTWKGISIYLPVDIYNVGSECVYKFTASITQKGKKLNFVENIYEFYDIDMNKKETIKPRLVVGSGKMLGDSDLIINFNEPDSLTCGTMYLLANNNGSQLSGMISVRNPKFPASAGVKIVLRKDSEPELTVDDLNLDRIKAMADAYNN